MREQAGRVRRPPPPHRIRPFFSPREEPLEEIMRSRSYVIALTLSALLVGGCAIRPDVMRDKDNPYENTDRPIVPSEKTNRPIVALDFGTRLMTQPDFRSIDGSRGTDSGSS